MHEHRQPSSFRPAGQCWFKKNLLFAASQQTAGSYLSLLFQFMQMALKCADICNPCRPWELSKQWSEKVTEEFFQQGYLSIFFPYLFRSFFSRLEVLSFFLFIKVFATLLQETLRRSTNLKSAHFATER